MAPKRNAKSSAATVTASPRKTRSATAGKRVVPPPLPVKRPPKKAKVTADKENEKPAVDLEAPVAPTDGTSRAEVVIEACKQCNSFKTRALKVKEGLESAAPGISITINPEKPRRGCFEVRDANGEVFISLLDMKRPFTPMKNLDMDKVIEDIIQKIN